MQRLRHRPDKFDWRGNSLSFHRLQDGPTLGRLDPYAAGEQTWLLHSGRTIAVTAEEVRNISKQVHGLDLPETRPDGGSCNCGARMDDFERRLAALEAQPAPTLNEALDASIEDNPDLFDDDAPDLAAENERLRARLAELEAQSDPVPDVEEDASPLPPNPEEALLSDYGQVGDDVPADLAQLMMDDEPLADAVARLTPSIDELLDAAQVLSDSSMEQAIATFPAERFEEWTERLWAEKARLRTKRGTDEENLSREGLISRVAGLFMRVGAKR